MKLTNEQAEHLRKVVNFTLEFEEADYYDWLRDSGEVVAKNHVYYHAKMLVDVLEEHRLKTIPTLEKPTDEQQMETWVEHLKETDSGHRPS